jgi:hypothetical protein
VTHTYHDALPGYSDAQILHDHCGECEARAASGDHGIANLDVPSFARAWARATEWQVCGLLDLAQAEAPMLAVLSSVQVQLERFGVPFGQLPVGMPP